MTFPKYFGEVSARIHFILSKKRPVSLASHTAFITDPADVRACIAEHNCGWLQLSHYLVCNRPIIISFVVNFSYFPGSAIVSVTTIGTIEPDFKYVTVVCKQFPELIPVICEIFRSSVN